MAAYTKIDYRVRQINRYVVTRFHQSESGSGVETKGEYENFDIAYEVGYALCKAEHERLGWPPGDERIQYPQKAASLNAPVSADCASWDRGIPASGELVVASRNHADITFDLSKLSAAGGAIATKSSS